MKPVINPSRRAVCAALLLLMCALWVLPGCGREPGDEKPGFQIYFKDQNRNDLYPVPAILDESADPDTQILSIWRQMKSPGENGNYTTSVPRKAELISVAVSSYNLVMNFSGAYYEISRREELLFRAAVVRTYTQLPFINTVEFLVENQPLTLSNGSLPGPMSASRFVDIVGSGLNAYTEADVILYFSSADGTRLVPYAYSGYYSNAITLEQYVTSLLVKGPENVGAEGLATLPLNTKILSVFTSDGTCFVNFNQAFLEGTPGIRAETIIYSIVNTLTEVKGVSSVQITVNGSSKINYMDHVDLGAPLKRKLDLIVGP
ncbi:MAG: GerMN domain-containing protein [Lachnospiraceae bacterium]|nr:GerMN domain-containing protein [Lachnospiraceae bacterium]